MIEQWETIIQLTQGEQDTKQKCRHLAAQQGKRRQKHRTMTDFILPPKKSLLGG
uniref:Uncharacterized protein n=1 Tax=Anguilla anguilla TaxID=7936 RepID=A0A0E9VM82_ANGAN